LRIFPSGDEEWSTLDDTVRALVARLKKGESGLRALRIRGEAGAVYAAAEILDRRA